jgi:excisionase family DNA binding protein
MNMQQANTRSVHDLAHSGSSDEGRDAVMTVPEVAQELKCSKAHVYNLIKGGVNGVKPLPTISLGRKKLVRRSSFEGWKRATESNPLGGTLATESEINTVGA